MVLSVFALIFTIIHWESLHFTFTVQSKGSLPAQPVGFSGSGNSVVRNPGSGYLNHGLDAFRMGLESIFKVGQGQPPGDELCQPSRPLLLYPGQ